LIPPRSKNVLGDIIPIYGYSVNENEKIFIENKRKILLFNTKNDALCRCLTHLGEVGKIGLIFAARGICLKKRKRIAKTFLI